MATFKVETKNKVDIDKKPRVYFTCHPDDFEKHFKKICEDIFKTHDCAIYYTEDMTEAIAEDEKTVDLGRNNLFVVPVTFKLLSTPNRAMDEDIPYALKEHIPVLPIMMESGIDEFYSKPDKFGELQYLNPYSTDLTEVSYEEKLKKYLESVLISDELAKRVRAAFDAYIFLSYRKKDRKFANELMRLIHRNPECRDIAIWFDEFLTPGESFKENIEKILDDCKLFTLLVTPKLLEKVVDENGEERDNYVISTELPLARKNKEEKGTDILAVEMEKTDKKALSSINVEDYVNFGDSAFRERLLDAISRMAITTNNTPEHNFLIGLAYLEGIDVEVDHERAVGLITSAAEAELPEAMEKLCEMYANGVGSKHNYQEAVKWAEKIVYYYTKHLGENHPNTISALINLTSGYKAIGDYNSALNFCTQTYELCCKTYSENDSDTISSILMLASIYGSLGDQKQALSYNQKAYELCRVLLGEEDPLTLTAINNLAIAYGNLGKKRDALSYFELLYSTSSRLLGLNDDGTLTILNNLAMTHNDLGNHTRAIELIQNCYQYRCNTLGENHPDTIAALGNWAVCLGDSKQYAEAFSISSNVYKKVASIYGENHPDTLLAKYNLAMAHYYLRNLDEALILMEPVYIARTLLFGKRHKDVRDTRENLAVIYDKKSNECFRRLHMIKAIKFSFLAYKTLLGF